MPRATTPLEPLRTAFERQVLNHPRIKALLQEVREEPALFDQSPREYPRSAWPSWRLLKLLEGSFVDDAGLWRANADGSLRDQAEGRSLNLSRVTPDACRVLLAVSERFGEFMAPLRDGTTIAQGHIANGNLVQLSAGIWRGPSFWIDISAGSVGDFQEIGEGTTGFRYIPRWSAIALERLSQIKASSGPLREKAALQRVATAVDALWPNAANVPRRGAKARDGQILDWLKKEKLEPVSSASIRRYLQLRREALR